MADEIKNQTPELKDFPKPDFTQLMLIFVMQAQQALGMIPEKESKNDKPNLPMARYSIDMLVLIQEKTKGNLTSDEAKILEDVVAGLQMQYVRISAV
jgi:hypothetical protein